MGLIIMEIIMIMLCYVIESLAMSSFIVYLTQYSVHAVFNVYLTCGGSALELYACGLRR